MIAAAIHHGYWLHWLSHILGLDNGSGPFYLLHSGAAGYLGDTALIGILFGSYHKHNCHVHRCWRLSRHPVDGTGYIVCKKHHPALPERVTVEHIADAHAEANQ